MRHLCSSVVEHGGAVPQQCVSKHVIFCWVCQLLRTPTLTDRSDSYLLSRTASNPMYFFDLKHMTSVDTAPSLPIVGLLRTSNLYFMSVGKVGRSYKRQKKYGKALKQSPSQQFGVLLSIVAVAGPSLAQANTQC